MSSVGSIATKTLEIEHKGKDGGRNHPLLEVVEATLKKSSIDVTITPTETTLGVPQKGINVVSAYPAILHIYGSEEESTEYEIKNNQNAELQIRIGSRDLNIPPLSSFFNVVEFDR